MGKPLTERRTPHELASSQQVIELANKIGEFERLCSVVEADLGALDEQSRPDDWREALVVGRIQFGFAGVRGDLPALDGRVETTVYAVCQRCLEPMRLTLNAELRLLLTDGEYDGYEVWELDEAAVRPLDIVDEVLVMAMPLSAMHEQSERCRRKQATTGTEEHRTRPFAALRRQMQESD